MSDDGKNKEQLINDLTMVRIHVAELEKTIAGLKRGDEKCQLLSNMIESSDDAIVTKTLEGIITSWNSGAEAVYGYTEAEVMGKSISLLIPPGRDNELPQLLKKIKYGEHIKHYDTVRRKKDGSEIHISLSLSPITDNEGQVVGAATIARDITENKRLEALLRRREEQYRSFFQNNHAILLVIDPEEGLVLDANPAACRYYGYTLHEIRMVKITDINTLGPEQVFEEMSRAQAEQRNHFFSRHRMKSGEVRSVEVYSGPIDMGERQLLYSIVHDISDRVRAEEEKEKLISDLTKALTKIKTLSGMLPICSSCKKIRNDKGYWEQLEVYLSEHSEAEFSHGMCPDCLGKFYPGYKKK